MLAEALSLHGKRGLRPKGHSSRPTKRRHFESTAQRADQDEYRALLEAALREPPIKHKRVSASLSKEISPVELADLIKANDIANLLVRDGINKQHRKPRWGMRLLFGRTGESSSNSPTGRYFIDCITPMRHASRQMRAQPRKTSREKPTRITVTLQPKEHSVVCKLAQEQRVSASWVLRDALHLYLKERQKGQIR
jgi:hypothetical protein